MISTIRSLSRQLRVVFRLALQLSASSSTPVMFRTGKNGLLVAAQSASTTAIFHQPGKSLVDETIFVPFACLTDCEGKKEIPLTLESRDKNRGLLSWQDGTVQQAVQVNAGKDFESPTIAAEMDREQALPSRRSSRSIANSLS